MIKTRETDALLKQCKIKGRNPDPWKLCRKLERERDEARAIAKYWQEQFGHSNTEHEWQSLPWEDGK